MKRHEPDWTSLIAGVTFCIIALAYLGGEISHRSLEIRWVLPILLIGLGLAGLAGTIVSVRRRSVPGATPTGSEARSDDELRPSSP